MADVEVTNNTDAHRFEVNLDGEVAFAEYRWPDHGSSCRTPSCREAFEGKGVASALAKAAFGYARDHGLKVIPTCPFMSAWVKKHPGAARHRRRQLQGQARGSSDGPVQRRLRRRLVRPGGPEAEGGAGGGPGGRR